MKCFRVVAAIAVTLFVSSAASAATFTVSALNNDIVAGDSGVAMSRSAGGCGFFGTSECASASLAGGLNDYSFDLNNVGDTAEFDFLTFTGKRTGGAIYDVTAQLGFSSPTTNGDALIGGIGGVKTFFGHIVAGALLWDTDSVQVGFGNGGIIEVSFGDGVGLFLGKHVTTKATVELVQGEVPLPAAGWMLLAGLGGLILMRRRASA